MFRHIKKANLWSIMWLGLLHDRVERDNSENCWNTWKAKKTFSYRKSRLRKENRMETFLWKRSLARNLVACCFKIRFVSSKWLTEKSLCKCERMGMCYADFLYVYVCLSLRVNGWECECFGCVCACTLLEMEVYKKVETAHLQNFYLYFGINERKVSHKMSTAAETPVKHIFSLLISGAASLFFNRMLNNEFSTTK